jgi:D-alanyl-lipoteichoic acid acyltransferase DltB (MBOAT superfamily)
LLFNSIDFAIFLPVVFGLYWLLKDRYVFQNWLLISASYVFYGWWDYRFLAMIVISSLTDFVLGQQIESTVINARKKLLLWTSIVVNIGILGYFKYFNFFIDSFSTAFDFFGNSVDVTGISIILPVGISFYTFQTLSYSIDIYRGQLKAARSIHTFFAYVSFFPQLVAGPIERAKNLLPQFQKRRVFDYDQSKDGLRFILWGLAKKIIIADTSAVYANEIFSNHESYGTPALLLGAVYFAFQIYGDFSGYTDIAIGTAKLFGFNLMRNFYYPYFSKDIADFWRRWHISLSSWFKDYLYIPLGGSKVGRFISIRNIFIIFLVSGLWHGANWTFVLWGFVNAVYFLPLYLLKKNRRNVASESVKSKVVPGIREVVAMLSTFALVVLAWILFRADTVQDAFSIYRKIFSFQDLSLPPMAFWKYTPLICVLLIWEWFSQKSWHGLDFKVTTPLYVRWPLYYFLIYGIIFYWGESQEFIYFAF